MSVEHETITQANEHLVKQAAQLSALFDALPNACYAVDQQGKCVYVNIAAEQLLGGNRAYLIGREPWPTGSLAQVAHEQAQRERRPTSVELFVSTIERRVELLIAPAGDLFLATARDIQEKRQQEARIAAERAVERLARLQEATAAFGRALSPERVADVVVNAGIGLLGAVAASIALLHDDGATLEVLRSVGYSPETLQHWRTFPLATPAPIADAIRRRQTIQLASLAERNAQYPHLAAAYPHSEECSWLAVPMMAGERVVGAIGLEFKGSRSFDPDDSSYLQTLAQQAAYALERTRLYQETQAALQASDEALVRLDLVLNTAPVGMALWDAGLRYIHINHELASLNGVPVHEHIGHTLPELFPQLAEVVQPLLESVLQTGEVINNMEFHGRHGQTLREGDWLLSFYPVKLSSGRIVGVGAVVIDITERKRDDASRALMSEITAAFAQALTVADVLDVLSRQVAQALDVGAMLIARLSGDGVWLEVEQAYGYPIVFVERYGRVPLGGQSPLTEAARTGQRIWIESRVEQLTSFPNDTGNEQALGTWAALPLIVNGRAIGAVGLTFNTFRHFDSVQREFIYQIVQQFAQSYERARLHEAERQALSIAEDAVKIRDQFLSIAAHELKTPLTSLLGNTQLLERHLRRNGNLNEREQHSLDVVVSQSRRLNQMIMALLDIARIQGGQLSIAPAETNLTQLVQRVVAEVEPTLTQHTLVCETPLQSVIIQADELRLEQVLQNLIQNAIKYSPKGGQVRIVLEQSEEAAHIQIHDQGLGIPDEAHAHLFERFYRATNADPQRISGMGIGLFVVKQIVELHGGDVTVTSTEGVGSTFTVTLPKRTRTE